MPSGCTQAEFVSFKQTMFVNGLASICELGVSQVEVLSVHDYATSASARRLLSQRGAELV